MGRMEGGLAASGAAEMLGSGGFSSIYPEDVDGGHSDVEQVFVGLMLEDEL